MEQNTVLTAFVRLARRNSGMCLFFSFVLSLLPVASFAQTNQEITEVLVSVNVRGIGKTELQAMIVDEKAYLPVATLFDYLQIRNTPSALGDSLSGFYVNVQAEYIIDKPGNRIVLKEQVFNLEPDALLYIGQSLYLSTEYFTKIFSLNATFNFRNLGVEIIPAIELPRVREQRLEDIRHNIIQLKGNIRADTLIKCERPFFHFGMADWMVTATEQDHGYTDLRANLGIGFSLLGGEGYASLNYSKNQPVKERDQYYLWRYANNDHRGLRQVLVGKIFVPTISSIYGPIVGIQATNSPTSFRRSFGSYTVANYTKPGWKVELYVNNVLVEYKTADASGYYSFDVPLVYGNSAIKLRFYGPNGEESSREENISIPFNFLPKKTLEYTASVGIIEDNTQSRFSRVNINYGISRRMTIGTGYEYLSTLKSNTFMPFVNGSVWVLKNMLVTGDYVHNVRSRGILTYRLPFNMQLEVNYIRYKQGQTAINNNYLEERKFVFSVPLHSRHFSLYSRLALNEIVLPTTKFRTGELIFSGNVLGVNTNVSTYVSLFDEVYPNTYSIVSLGFRLPKGILFTPQFQYEYKEKQLVSLKALLEKSVFKHGFLNLSYEQNYFSNIRNYGLGFRYDFSFAQVSMATVYSGDQYTAVQSAKGSLLVDRKSRLFEFSDRSSQGRGGIVVTSFLDINGNGKRDEGEPKAPGFKFRVNAGRVVYNKRDTNASVFDLEPYQTYFIEPEYSSFDNITWRIKKQVIGAAVAANQFTDVDIPVSVVAEVSGKVSVKGRKKGLERMLVYVKDKDGKVVSRLMTEEDGYFIYSGLLPGSYTISLDGPQLEKLGYTAETNNIPFNVRQSTDGEEVGDLQFILTPVK